MDDEDDFGARDLLLEDEEDEFSSRDIDMSDDFGAEDLPEQDNSWGRFFLRKPRGLIAGGGGLPGDIETLLRSNPGNIGDIFLTQEEAENNQLPPVEEQDRYLYNTEDIKKRIDEEAKKYGYDLAPRGFWEEAEDKALEFAGAGGALGTVTKGFKGAKAAASLPELVSSGAMGVASQTGEHYDLPPLARLALTGYAGHKGRNVAPSTAKSALNATKEAVKHPIKTTKELTAKGVAKLGKPKTEVIEAAERRGINPTLSNVVESRPLQATETMLKESSLTGSAYEKKLGEITKETKESFDKILDNISTDPRTARDIGESALKRLEKNFLESKEKYTDLYVNSAKAIPKDELIPYASTQKSIKDIRSSLEKTALVKGQRAETLKVLDEISNNLRKEAENHYVKNRLDQLRTSTGQKAKPTPNQLNQIQKEARQAVRNGKGEVSPSTLLGTEDSLNDFIDWYAQGGTKKTLKHIVRGTKEDIASYAQKNAKFGDLYKEADKEFANHAKTLRSDLIKSITKKQVPEEILSKMNSVSNIRKIEAALAQNPDGKKVMQSLKRAKFQELLEGKMLDNEGKIKWGTFGTALKDPKRQDLYKELVGPQNYRRLQDVQKFSSDLANTTAKFANTSKTAVLGRDIAVGGAILTQFFLALKTGGLSELALALGKAGLKGSVLPFMAKLLTDEEFVNMVIKAGRNAKNPQASKIYHDQMVNHIVKVIASEGGNQAEKQQKEK